MSVRLILRSRFRDPDTCLMRFEIEPATGCWIGRYPSKRSTDTTPCAHARSSHALDLHRLGRIARAARELEALIADRVRLAALRAHAGAGGWSRSNEC